MLLYIVYQFLPVKWTCMSACTILNLVPSFQPKSLPFLSDETRKIEVARSKGRFELWNRRRGIYMWRGHWRRDREPYHRHSAHGRARWPGEGGLLWGQTEHAWTKGYQKRAAYLSDSLKGVLWKGRGCRGCPCRNEWQGYQNKIIYQQQESSKLLFSTFSSKLLFHTFPFPSCLVFPLPSSLHLSTTAVFDTISFTLALPGHCERVKSAKTGSELSATIQKVQSSNSASISLVSL